MQPFHKIFLCSEVWLVLVHCSLQPSGGSGMYIWTSSNTSVATVSTKGIVMTTSAIGYTQVCAADMKNPANFDTSEVSLTHVFSGFSPTFFFFLIK